METQEKGLAVAALLIDVLSAYILVKRIMVRTKTLRPARVSVPSSRRLDLVS